MPDLIISNILILGGIAIVAAIVLYFTYKKFFVEENPKIDEIENYLPNVNCGACGKAGCRDFASACVNSDAVEFSDLYCPVGGVEVMNKIADFLGFEVKEKEKTAAVIRCQGTCQNAPDKILYTGLQSCRLANRVSVGKSGCLNGCLRFGDCAKVCKFDALYINPETGLPEVNKEKCTSCLACVNICPRGLFEIRPLKTVFTACRNKQKGVIARKNCKMACIACMKCTKVSDLIKVENNLSYIPTDIDIKLSQELKSCCPTGAIISSEEK